MKYLSTTIIKPPKRTVDNMSVADYSSLGIVKINSFIKTLPSNLFELRKVDEDDKWERISLEIYGNADYWDILVILNNRSTLFGLPFDFDVVDSITASVIRDYEQFVYKQTLNESVKTLMFDKTAIRLGVTNDSNHVINIVKPNKMSEFLQLGYVAGVFQ